MSTTTESGLGTKDDPEDEDSLLTTETIEFEGRLYKAVEGDLDDFSRRWDNTSDQLKREWELPEIYINKQWEDFDDQLQEHIIKLWAKWESTPEEVYESKAQEEGSPLAQGTVQDYYSQAYDNDEAIKDTLQCEYCFQQYDTNTTDDQTMIDHVNDKHNAEFSNESKATESGKFLLSWDEPVIGQAEIEYKIYGEPEDDGKYSTRQKMLAFNTATQYHAMMVNSYGGNLVANLFDQDETCSFVASFNHADGPWSNGGAKNYLGSLTTKKISNSNISGGESKAKEGRTDDYGNEWSTYECGHCSKRFNHIVQKRGTRQYDSVNIKSMDEAQDKLRAHRRDYHHIEESTSNEEGMASVSGPPAGTEPTVREEKDNTFVLPADSNETLVEDDLADRELEQGELGESTEEDEEYEEQMNEVCTKCGYEISEHDGQDHEFNMRDENTVADEVSEIDSIMLNENYIQLGDVLYRPRYTSEEAWSDDLIFENKFYTSEGVGNCQFCKGAGKITVERLGLKECPDCEGTGDVQGNPMAQDPMAQDPMTQEPILGEVPDVPNIQQEEVPDVTEPKKPNPFANGESKKKSSESKKSCKPCRKTMAHEASVSKFKSFINSKITILQKKAKAGESVSLMYGLPTVTRQGRKIKGTLAYAGVSLNDRIYLPEELEKGHGLTLPLLLNHSSTAGAEDELDRLDDKMLEALYNEEDYEVGEVTLTWDASKLTLFYEGVVENEFFQKEIDDMDMAVSLGIYYDSDSPRICDVNCYTLIKGAEFREVSLVYHAGFPIATIEAVEAQLKKRALKSIEKEEKLSDTIDRINKKNEPDGGWREEDKVEETTGADIANDIVGVDIAEEEIAEEEQDDLARGGSVDVEEIKDEGPAPTIDLNDEWEGQTIVTEMFTPDNFSVRGVSGMTISNANGVERYTFDPAQNYSTNTIHFQTFGDGASIFGETLQPKMATPDELTKVIEAHPDIVVEDADKDAFESKKNKK